MLVKERVKKFEGLYAGRLFLSMEETRGSSYICSADSAVSN